MAEIVIDELTVENFGPYYGSTTFDFTPDSENGKCSILIGGKNGAGKTHLLRALYLAIVGDPGVNDLKKMEGKSGINKFDFGHALNRKAAAEGQDICRFEIKLTKREVSGAETLTLVREVHQRPKSQPAWKSHVITSEGKKMTPEDKEEGEGAVIRKLRDAFLPRYLARFFFFDAEGSQNLSLTEKDVIEGIARILGLWTFKELEEHLRSLIKIKVPKDFGSNLLGKETRTLSDINAKIQKIEEEIESYKSEKQEKETELADLELAIVDVEEKLKATGTVEPKEIEKEEENRDRIKEEKTRLTEKLKGAWEKELPLSLLGAFRGELNTYLKKEEERSRWEQKKETVEPEIPEIERKVFEGPAEEFELSQECRNHYCSRLRQALKGLFNPPPAGMSESVYVCDRMAVSAQVRWQLCANLPSVDDIRNAFERLDRLSADLLESCGKLKDYQQDKEAIKQGNQLREKRGQLINEKSNIEREIDNIGKEIKQLKLQLPELKREESNQLKKVRKAEKGKSLILLAGQYQQAVGKIQKKAADEMRGYISETVGNLWIPIVGRKCEFQGMHFDEQWSCFLECQHTRDRVPWGEAHLSAGQKQVRVLAFYEALRRLAQRVPPLVVDTPLGRLDQEVRQAVLEKIYLQGHQSIILATNSEIDPEGPLFDLMKDSCARVYTLEPRDQPDSPYYKVCLEKDTYFGQSI